uniref:hypothetical protein n=1 Tax=Flavobacterium sp. TaxID=239 RepID=UPI0040487B87
MRHIYEYDNFAFLFLYMTNSIKLLVFIFISFSTGALAQQKKTIATTKTSEFISIDANLNEKSWKNAEIATDFVSFEPKNGTPIPKEFRTEVKVL